MKRSPNLLTIFKPIVVAPFDAHRKCFLALVKHHIVVGKDACGLMTKRLLRTLVICGLIIYTLIGTSCVTPTVLAPDDSKNVILIGWDGVQRNHLFELMNRGKLTNLTALIKEGTIANITVMDHRTDTKSGWTQILTGYRWWRTGVYSNVYWFHSIPAGYTLPERVESRFGKNNVTTAFIIGKLGHMEVQSGTGSTPQGKFTQEAIYANIPSQVDVCNVDARNANVVGPLTLQFLENYANNRFFAFFHFSDPDSAGHNQQLGGENSALYEQAIELCDYWLGQIINKLNTLNITQKTLIYVTADHGFDEGGKSHNYAPYIFLATNDKNVKRNGDEVDVAPTIYYGLGMWGNIFNPALDGYPLQLELPSELDQKRQIIMNDTTPPPKASIISPAGGAYLNGIVSITFKVSDQHLSAVLILIDNTLKTDGPWTWNHNNVVEANGAYNWDTTNTNIGSHAITILAFDEHGATNSPSNSTIKVNVVISEPRFPKIPTPQPSPAPQQSPEPKPSPTPTPQPNNQSTTPPVVPPPNNPPVQEPQPSFLGSSLPMEYGYAAVAVIAFSLATGTGYLYYKRRK